MSLQHAERADKKIVLALDSLKTEYNVLSPYEKLKLLNAYAQNLWALKLENSPRESIKKRKANINWRLAYNPRCIMLGISTLLHVSAIMVAYPSIPPLGEQTGNFSQHFHFRIINLISSPFDKYDAL